MTDCPDNGRIPQHCSDEFGDIKGRLGRIETKLEMLCDHRKTLGRWVWDITKGVVLLVAGFVLAELKK